MKKNILMLGLLTITSTTYASPIVCTDKDSNDPLVVLFYNSKKKEVEMNVKTEAGSLVTLSAVNLSEKVYEGRNGFYKNFHPILDLNNMTLTLDNNETSVICSPYYGGE